MVTQQSLQNSSEEQEKEVQKNKHLLRLPAYWLTFLFTFGLAAVIALVISTATNRGIGLSVFVAIGLALIIDGLTGVQVVYKAAPKFLGKRLKKLVLHEGWWLLPLRFLGVWGMEEVFVGFQNLDLDGIEHKENDKPKRDSLDFLSRDNVLLTANVHLTYFAHNPIAFMDAGEAKGVDDAISDILRSSVRQWGRRREWTKALGSEVQVMQQIIRDVRTINAKPTPDEVRDATSGNGDFPNERFGITVVRISLSKIIPPEEITEASRKLAKEENERKAELIQNKAVVDMVLAQTAEGIPMSEAIRSVQLERGKATKAIDEKVVSVTGALESVLPDLVAALANRKKG